jgi:hypothetical protein
VAAIAPGKLHRLRNCSTAAGRFVILAADHRNSLRRALMPEAPNRVDYATLAGPKAGLVQALSPARGCGNSVGPVSWPFVPLWRSSVAPPLTASEVRCVLSSVDRRD